MNGNGLLYPATRAQHDCKPKLQMCRCIRVNQKFPAGQGRLKYNAFRPITGYTITHEFAKVIANTLVNFAEPFATWSSKCYGAHEPW